jgi:transglutaminase-like putative cysteine protease
VSQTIIAVIILLAIYVIIKIIQTWVGDKSHSEETKKTALRAMNNIVDVFAAKAKTEFPKIIDNVSKDISLENIKTQGEQSLTNIVHNAGREILNIAKSETPKLELIHPIMEKLYNVLDKTQQEELLGDLKNNTYIISDDLDHPFRITPTITAATKIIVGDLTEPLEVARAIYDWFEANIEYGETKRGQVGYRNALEVFQSKEGICGEMAILYVVMARSQGLDSRYCSVHKDNKNQDVHHACAVLQRPNAKPILIDPAYHIFNIEHQKYKILTDSEAIETFKQWR